MPLVCPLEPAVADASRPADGVPAQGRRAEGVPCAGPRPRAEPVRDGRVRGTDQACPLVGARALFFLAYRASRYLRRFLGLPRFAHLEAGLGATAWRGRQAATPIVQASSIVSNFQHGDRRNNEFTRSLVQVVQDLLKTLD